MNRPGLQRPKSPIERWFDALAVYRQPRVAAMLFLGFSAGLPFALVDRTLSAWLEQDGVELATIGLFALVGTFYAIKFAWAPLVDQLKIPWLTNALGRRRSWMLAGQVGVVAALLGMSTLSPAAQLGTMVWLAVLGAFSSATQDIAIDAWRIESASTDEQGALAAAYQLGYRTALLLATGGVFLIADFSSWALAYKVMALLMGVGVITALVVAEPDPDSKQLAAMISPAADFSRWFQEAVINPFADFFVRNGRNALWVLLFIGIYRISDSVLGVMANPFYLQLGLSLTEIGVYGKFFGYAAVLIGAVGGGVAVARYGLSGPLVFGAVILALTNLCFSLLAAVGANVPLFVATIMADNIAQGFSGTVFIAYLSGLTNISYTATQYALFTSLMVLPGKLLSSLSGYVAESVGWVTFFAYAAVMGLPAIYLATRVNTWFAEEKR